MTRRLVVMSCLAILAVQGCSSPSSAPGATTPGGSSSASSAISWTKFEDPAEHAFTLEVPQGWTVKGGLFRMGYSDARAMVDMTSPDGRTNIRIGDVSIPVYTVPVQNHTQEGSVYDLGAQARLIVARYRTGPEFAALYSQVRFYSSCKSPTADPNDVNISVPDFLPPGTESAEASSGEIAYHCETPQGPAVAFAYARTSRTGDIWSASILASFIAPADQVSAAGGVLVHCAKSLQIAPQWIEFQKQMDAEGLQYQRARQQQRMAALGQQVQQFEAKMQAMRQQVASFEAHQAGQASQVESFTNVLNGITPTIDPMTGEARNVWTGGAAHYYANGLGQVVNANSAPSASWHEINPTGH